MKILSKFFGKKNPLDVPMEKLKESRIKLEYQIQKIENDINGIEKEITLLFDKAKVARSKSEELTIATKIKTLNQKKESLKKVHAQLNKQLMVVNNLIIIKENEELLKGTPTWKMLRNMSPEELETKLAEMQFDVYKFNEGLETTLRITNQAMETGVDFEDDEIEEIMKTIHAVKEGELDPENATKKVDEKAEKNRRIFE